MSVLGIIGKILLVLLKILLILLLVVLALLLLILLLPISYEATAKADGEKGLKGVDARAAVKYCFGLLRFRFHFSGGDMAYTLKLAGKTLKRGASKAAEAREEPEEEAFDPELEEDAEPQPEPLPEEKETVAQAEPEEKTEEPVSVHQPEKQPEERHRPAWEAEPEEKGPIGDRMDHARDQWDALRDKVLWLWDQFQDPGNRKTAARVTRVVKRILRHVLPGTVKGKVLFGTGDPASTGQILGAFYALYPFYADRWELQVSGDFEEKKLKGKVYVAGRIRLMVIVLGALNLLADKNIRRLLKQRRKKK